MFETSAERNACSVVAVVLFVDVKFVSTSLRSTGDFSIP